MGLVITLCLILINVYNAIDGPPSREYIYIEILMIGMELPILVAALGYSIMLGIRRCHLKFIENCSGKVDAITCVLSILYIISFSVYYWLFMIPQM